MKKSIAILLLTFIILELGAQISRLDTVVLSVYNNSGRYMLTFADFGPITLTKKITGEMVMVYDTIITFKDKTKIDTAKNKEPRFDVTRICDKPLDNIKDKIVVMDLNKDCDVTVMCLNVQKAGAKALIIIHNSNLRGTIKLPKKGSFKDRITIPIFTVRKEIGENITSLLPSLVGISLKIPNNTFITGNNMAINPDVVNQQNKIENALTVDNREVTSNEISDNAINLPTPNLKKANFTLSPNPTKDMAYLQYALPTNADMILEVKNNLGQVVYTQQLRGVQVGTIELSTEGWSNNVYIVELSYGKKKVQRKLVVQR